MSPARAVLLIAVLIYAACLPLDAFCVDGKCSDWQGWAILAFGWLVLAGADANMAWLANPVLFIAWLTILLRQRLVAIFFAIGALALGAGFLTFKTVVTNEGGIVGKITGYKVGYWIWLAGMAVTILAALLVRPPQADER